MTEHIRVTLASDHVCVIVDDYEVMDFVDDFLTEECDIGFEYLLEEIVDGRTVFALHFPEAVTIESVLQAIRELDPDEVERIWRLNN